MIEKSIAAGLAGNELSKKITGTEEVCTKRSVVATGAGASLGYVAAAGTTTALSTAGFTAAATMAAPVVVPAVILAGGVALALSLFD